MILQLGDVAVPARFAEIVGITLLAGGLVSIVAMGYRWYSSERIQEGLAVLVGLGTVAVYLNTTGAISLVIDAGTSLFDLEAALLNVGTFLLSGLTALVGRHIGDRIAVEATVVTGRRRIDTDVSRLVSSVGRVVAVTLPEDIHDMDGYDPVATETKEALVGTTLLFPRRLSVAELEDRLRSRLADDYGVGHVDVELNRDGVVDYLAVGSRAAGLGPTLAPGTAAVAVRADPPFAASSGDVVELWRTDPEPTHVTTGELRGAAGDVATIALDEPDAMALDPATNYRLVTHAATPRADRQFASVLRTADERLAAVTVEADSELIGTPLAEREVAIIAVQPSDEPLAAVPDRSYRLSTGDVVYAVGRPDVLRRLEAAAASPEPEPSS